jgi:hypothetical protein
VRWPKMVGPDGRDSPSGIGPFLVWQQPHPIYLSELVYRARPRRRVLERYRDIVFASAEFMASYPWWDEANRRYVLGPPLIPAQESHPPRTTYNPTFELAYWAFGLSTAQRWRERLGLEREPAWDRVLNALSPLPMRDGLYVNTESAPTTFTDANQRRDHPTLLGAYGFVASPRVEPEAMRRTLRKVFETWQWRDTWGWDYPLVAMTAARRLDSKEFCLSEYDALKPAMSFTATTPNAARRWQQRARPKLIDRLGGFPSRRAPLNAEVLETTDLGAYTREKIAFDTRENLSTIGYLLLPKNAPRPLPAVVSVSGHGRGVPDIVGMADDVSQRDERNVGYA